MRYLVNKKSLGKLFPAALVVCDDTHTSYRQIVIKEFTQYDDGRCTVVPDISFSVLMHDSFNTIPVSERTVKNGELRDKNGIGIGTVDPDKEILIENGVITFYLK